MPAILLKSSRAEAKYNVTTDFQYLGLHSAAATGNVGLVKYALEHGQPVNSVLDGLLPLHAACSGGSQIVVELLIESGADVNAQRLPRRYTNEKHRDTSAPNVGGTSGSTPLHFAASNGHTDIIAILLNHGAIPSVMDKHGVTPEMIARQNGWIESANLLKEWEAKRERMAKDGKMSQDPKRLNVKRSIDNALTKLRSAQSMDKLPSTIGPSTSRPPLPRNSLSNDRSPLPTTPNSGRCPLPSQPLSAFSPPPSSSKRRSSKRPSSAGSGADRYGSASSMKQLNPKYSLMNLFKRGQTEENPPIPAPPAPFTAPVTTVALPELSPESARFPKTAPPTTAQRNSRDQSPYRKPAPTTDSALGIYPEAAPSMSAVDIHRALMSTHQHHFSLSHSSPHHSPRMEGGRERAGSNGSILLSPGSEEGGESPRRPGILKHGRSASSGIALPSPPPMGLGLTNLSGSSTPSAGTGEGLRAKSSLRMLRFDSSSSAGSAKPQMASRLRLDSVGSDSLASFNANRSSPGGGSPMVTPIDDGDEYEEYGRPLERTTIHVVGSPRTRVEELKAEGAEERALKGLTVSNPTSSTSSNTGSTTSLILGFPIPNTPPAVATATQADFPFGIDKSPPSDGQLLTVPNASSPQPNDNRHRGDSVSSTSTDGSANPQLSFSGTTAASGSFVETPSIVREFVLPPNLEVATQDGVLGEADQTQKPPIQAIPTQQPKRPRPHIPHDINIRSISSHAQAEALVHETEQSIFELADHVPGSAPGEDDLDFRSQLSAKLAQYGETLAIERQLKEEEEAKRRGDHRRTGSGGQFREPVATKVRVPKRPNTSSGTSGERFPPIRPIAETRRPSQPNAFKERGMLTAPPTQTSYSRARNQSEGNFLNVETFPRLVRTTTPDPWLASGRGEELSRVTTAPTPEHFGSFPRPSGDLDRRTTSANKLARMGLGTTEGWQAAPALSTPPPSTGTKSRFGLKNLMQSLKKT